ncbi:hypothetical protein C1T31_03045 [Hanstruepera neustonica]|uniref:Uncharacterized protein n=1 Tax=Hanstruepera neustonica TaxID=1445657 RepID=A0A2K1E4B5_9FLAO|nr:hypothetical protein [Hanstruepera neustonica]PNQ75128.1 hypothetical protein C1T31_03045 [Hanstruepera neustonica]
MKKAFLIYVLTLVVILGGLMQLHAHSSQHNDSVSYNELLNTNVASLSSSAQFLHSSTHAFLKFKKVFAELTENEEIDGFEKSQSSKFSDDVSTIFLHSFFKNNLFEFEELSLGCHKPSKAFSYKRYIKFEVFRI